MKLLGPCIVAILFGFQVGADATAFEDAISLAATNETEGRFEVAATLYEDVIEDIVRSEGEFSPMLVEPLIGLGRCHRELGDFFDAEQDLRRAQHVIHRNDGVHALRQLEIVDLMTDLHLRRDEPYDADREQHLALYINERNYGKESPELLPALADLAQWYTETGQYFRARSLLERAAEIVEADGGDQDPRLIGPLIEGAKVRRLQRVCCSYRGIEIARGIVEAHPELSVDLRASVYEALGDAYLASRKHDDAHTAYAKVWSLLGDEVAREKFDEPGQIAMGKDLIEPERSRMKVYTVDPTFPPGPARFNQLTLDEGLRLESQPPQQFLVPLESGGRNVHINDTYPRDDVIDPSQEVIGRPFQFIKKQLMQILPIRMQGDNDLALISLEIDFTVNSDGRVSNVQVLSDVPNKLARLMRQVLYKTTFRPRLVDGEPVTTEHFKITQTFDS